MSDTDFGAILDEWDGTADNEPSVATETPVDASNAPAGDETDAPSGKDASEPVESSGQPRDASGRFAPKSPTAEETVTPPAAKAPATATNASDTQVPNTTAVEGTPYSFRSMNQEVPLAGVIARPDGSLVVSPEGLPQLQQLLARGHEFATEGRRREQQYQAQIRELETKAGQPTLNEHRFKTAYTLLAQALDDPEMRLRLASDDDYRLLYMERVANALDRVAIDYERQQGEQRTKQSSVEADAQRETQFLGETVKRIAGSVEGLSPQDVEAALQHFEKYRAAVIRPATAEEAQLSGGAIKEGERVVVDYLIEEYLAERAKQIKAQAEAAKRAQDAARFNNAQKPHATPQKPRVAAAPAPTPATQPANGKKAFDDAFKNWDKRTDLSFDDDDE